MDRRRKPMYRAVIFDFDYTLGDSTDGIVLSVNHALDKLGCAKAPTQEIRKTIGLSLKNTYKALTKDEDEGKAALFAEYFVEKADEVMTDHSVLYPPVEDVIASLRERGIKTGIVTTKFHYRIDGILNKFGMNHAFDLVVGSDDVKIEKPDPEGLLWAISHLGVDKKEVLYIGDSIVDAETAGRAGVDFAGVLTGTTQRDAFETYECVGIIGDLTYIDQILMKG